MFDGYSVRRKKLSYSNFLQQVDKHNIATATLVFSQNTAEVHGELREPAREYRTTVPRESASDLTEPLRNAGVNVNVSRMPAWTGELSKFCPTSNCSWLGDSNCDDEMDAPEAIAPCDLIESFEYVSVRKASK